MEFQLSAIKKLEISASVIDTLGENTSGKILLLRICKKKYVKFFFSNEIIE